MKKNIYICIYILIALFVIGCSNQTTVNENIVGIEELQSQVKESEKKINELKEKNDSYEIEIKNLEEEKNTYKNFIDNAIQYLSEDEMLELAKSEWHYNIEVDGQPISPDGKIEINKNNFKIAYLEKQSSFISLPEEIHIQGNISGEYFDHLKIIKSKPKEIKRTDGTVVTGFIYEFENLSENTNIKLEISDELKERLGLQTNIINIHIK